MKTPLVLSAAMLVLLSACARQERAREIDWAKTALARNPAYEIVATDETAGVFTVRDTVTGTVQALKLEDLIATPRAARAAPRQAAPQPAVEQQPAAAPADADTATAQTTDTAEPEVPVAAGSGAALSSGPGYRIERAADGAAAQQTAVTLEGPGYRITRHETGTVRAPQGATGGKGAEAIAANTEHRSDPIVCQGERLMRIDGETLSFSGDALIAEEGCDLFITNANIRAGGVGIIARRARVHIVNSTIDGERGSYEASDGAEMYVTSSTFTGIGRRFDNAAVTDLGGNEYPAN